MRPNPARIELAHLYFIPKPHKVIIINVGCLFIYACLDRDTIETDRFVDASSSNRCLTLPRSTPSSHLWSSGQKVDIREWHSFCSTYGAVSRSGPSLIQYHVDYFRCHWSLYDDTARTVHYSSWSDSSVIMPTTDAYMGWPSIHWWKWPVLSWIPTVSSTMTSIIDRFVVERWDHHLRWLWRISTCYTGNKRWSNIRYYTTNCTDGTSTMCSWPAIYRWIKSISYSIKRTTVMRTFELLDRSVILSNFWMYPWRIIEDDWERPFIINQPLNRTLSRLRRIIHVTCIATWSTGPYFGQHVSALTKQTSTKNGWTLNWCFYWTVILLDSSPTISSASFDENSAPYEELHQKLIQQPTRREKRSRRDGLVIINHDRIITRRRFQFILPSRVDRS